MSEDPAEPRAVWIPQVTLEGRRDDVNIYDLGAFTTEGEAQKAMEQWLKEERADDGAATEAVINIVHVYDTFEEWAEDR